MFEAFAVKPNTLVMSGDRIFLIGGDVDKAMYSAFVLVLRLISDSFQQSQHQGIFLDC